MSGTSGPGGGVPAQQTDQTAAGESLSLLLLLQHPPSEHSGDQPVYATVH